MGGGREMDRPLAIRFGYTIVYWIFVFSRFIHFDDFKWIHVLDIWLHILMTDCPHSSPNSNSTNMARFFSTLILGAVLFASQNNEGVEAFSPPSRSKVLNDLKEMRMTGAGGAAQPDSYNEGELSFTWNQG